jgi:hypothetical protein
MVEINKSAMGIFYFIQIIGILLIPIMITLYFILMSKKEEIQANWPEYRTKLYIIPFTSFLAPKGSNQTASENLNFYLGNIVKKVINMLLKPFYFIFVMIGEVIMAFGGSINSAKGFINNVRANILKFYSMLAMRIEDAGSSSQYVLIKFNDILGKLGGMQTTIQYVLIVLASTLEVIVNVIGGIVKLIVIILIAVSFLLWLVCAPCGYALIAISSGVGISYACFDPDTLINIGNNKKKIKNIKIGDILKGDNKVTAVLKFNCNNVQMYNYNNIIVSGSHLVKENDNWVRVEDSIKCYKINYTQKYIYCLSTDNATINIDNIIFADYIETSNNETIKYMYNVILNHLNNQNLTINNIRTDETLYHWGISGNTVIDMNNSKIKIKDCKIGDILSLSPINIVLGLIKFKVSNYGKQPLYNYKGMICTGSMIVYEDKQWIPVFNSQFSIKINNRPKYMYNIFTTNNTFICNNIKCCDFEQTNNTKINNIIDNYVSENL